MVVIGMVAIMTIVQDHVCEVRSASILNVQALVGMACPPNLAAAAIGLLIEVEPLVLRVLACPDLDLVEIIGTATSNIYTRIPL